MCQSTAHCGFYTFIRSEQTCTLKRHSHGTRIEDDDAMSGSVNVDVAPTAEEVDAPAGAEGDGDDETGKAGSADAAVDSERHDPTDTGGGSSNLGTVNRSTVANDEPNIDTSPPPPPVVAAASDSSPASGEIRDEEVTKENSHFCTEEHGRCRCSRGMAFGSFATKAKWLVVVVGNTKGLKCHRDTFGGIDPAPGVHKECRCFFKHAKRPKTHEVSLVAAPVAEADVAPSGVDGARADDVGTDPVNGTVDTVNGKAAAAGKRCAAEHDQCSCTGMVLFGDGQTLSQKHATWYAMQVPARHTGLVCEKASFAGIDPAPGVAKQCRCLAFTAGKAESSADAPGQTAEADRERLREVIKAGAPEPKKEAQVVKKKKETKETKETKALTTGSISNPPEGKRAYSSVLDKNAELNGRSMLGSASAWSADTATAEQWMQMDLSVVKEITGVITQGRSSSYESYVKEYTVMVSDDGSMFNHVVTLGGQPQLFIAGPSDTKITAAFDGPVKARFLRLVIKSWEGSISMRAGAIFNAAYVPGAAWCSDEGDSCTCAGTIFYGAHANLKWLTIDSPEKPQTLTCKGPTFGGDPVPSVRKHCRCLPTDVTSRKPHLKVHLCGRGFNKPVEKILQEDFNYMTTNANVDDDWDLIYGGYQHCGTKSHEWDMKTGLIPKIKFATMKPYQQWFNCMGCRGS